MVPYLSRKLFAIFVLLAVAVYSYFDSGIRLGLDLEGGARIVYRLDFEEAEIGPGEDHGTLLRETVDIFQRRIDGSGLREIPIYTQGSEEIVMELPDMSEEEVEQIKETIANEGRLEFRIVLTGRDDDGLGHANEVQKFRTWREANPEQDLAVFNATDESSGGPREGIAWYEVSQDALTDGSADHLLIEGLTALPVRLEDELRQSAAESWVFRGSDLDYVGPGLDSAGFNAVRFEFQEARKRQFGDFTEEYTNRPMGIILNDYIETAPNIQQRLPGGGIITGGPQGFAPDEMRGLITVLRTGSLKVKPELESESFVGPSLGRDSIRIGILSALIGGAVVLAFMILYYRINGLVATASLIFNGVILIGALAFTQATLTLPGLAGLVLTIGMAVDSNILIFERVREERRRGREVPQAYKNGFERAFTTIVDANLTTLITSVILYYVGTGPVRGFAAVLSLGILSSMFAALVFSKVLCHFLVFGKNPVIKEVKMAGVGIGENAFNPIKYRKAALSASLVLILGGLVVFAGQGSKMLGIDFTGGGMARVKLAQPMEISEFRATLGSDYTVTRFQPTVEGVSADASDSFLVKKKLTAAEREAFRESGGAADDSGEAAFLVELREKLGTHLDAEDPFPEASIVGPRVVDQIRDKAILAILFSMIAIVIYMNFRFKEYRYGLAAVIAVFHDVLFAMGALALVNKLGLVDVEINLEIIAAFLTIIGYSLNDTIVVFDRIRENLPRRKGSFPEIINLSINQSLSRTVITSLTTFFVVAVLFFANRTQHNVLEGFSFTMLVGVVVGTYSSIFIASPMLIFLDRWARKHQMPSAEESAAAAKSGKLKPATS